MTSNNNHKNAKKKHKGYHPKKGAHYQVKKHLRQRHHLKVLKDTKRLHPTRKPHKRTELEIQRGNYMYFAIFAYFFIMHMFTMVKTKVRKRKLRPGENFRNTDQSLFVIKTKCCPQLKYYSGWMTLICMVLTLLFFIFQATAEIDLCWDNSKEIYRGIEKKHVTQRTYLDFLRKSTYVFSILLAVQLSLWDSTPQREEEEEEENHDNGIFEDNTKNDDEEDEDVTLLTTSTTMDNSRRRQARRTRRKERKRKKRLKKLREKALQRLRIHWYNLLAVCILYTNGRIFYMIVKMSQQFFQDSNCAMETTYGSNSISIDYSMGIFCIMSYLRFIVKARNFNNSLYHANTYSLSSLIWRICGGCKFKSIQERNVIVSYLLLLIFNGILFARVLTTGMSSLRQIFYAILFALCGHFPFIKYLDTILPEGLEMNMPYRATPSVITPISYFGRRRYRIFTMLGFYLMFYITLLFGTKRYTNGYAYTRTILNVNWIFLDVLGWIVMVYILLYKMGAPRQGFVSYSSLMPSEGQFHS